MGLLSIIVPVYNAERYLKRCIESVINQLDRTDELILVEDGSPDKSGEICDYYAERYSYVKVIHQANGGVGKARNAGLKAACGEYIIFVDADDYVAADMVQTVKGYLDRKLDLIMFGQNPDSGRTVCKAAFDISIHDARMRSSFIKAVFSGKIASLETHHFYLRSSVAKAFCRRFLLENQIFFEEGVKIGEDMLYMLKVCGLFQKAGCVNQKIYYYYKNENSITNRYKPDLEDIIASYVRAIEPWLSIHPEYVPYHANYRLNDIILFIKYDFFHRENRERKSELKQRMEAILRKGNYFEYYLSSKQNDLLKSYGILKRITIWLAIHGRFFELRCIAKIKYGHHSLQCAGGKICRK